jgi:hypothetical protein
MIVIETVPSERISNTATFTVDTTIEKAFPLFGPLREKDWAEGWNPEILYGAEEVEKHMMFRTKSSFKDESSFLWVITQFEPEKYFIEYTVSTPNRVWFIGVQCAAKELKTNVSVTYTYTGLNAKGNELNRIALKKMFSDNLKDWEAAINFYLKHGKILISEIQHEHEK